MVFPPKPGRREIEDNFVIPPLRNTEGVDAANNIDPGAQKLSCHSIVKRRRDARRIRRSLFPNSDAEETDKWLDGMEQKIMDEKIEKWGFDFVNDKPLEPSTSSTLIDFECVKQEAVPSFYRSVSYAQSTVDETCVDETSASTSSRHQRNWTEKYGSQSRKNDGVAQSRSPEKRRLGSASPRKPTSTAVVTRMASSMLAAPSSSALLTAPRKVVPHDDLNSRSPRKMLRMDEVETRSSRNNLLSRDASQNGLESPTKAVGTSRYSASRRLDYSANSARHPPQNEYLNCASSEHFGISSTSSARNLSFAGAHDYGLEDGLASSPLVTHDGGKHARKSNKDHHKTPGKKR